MSEETKKESLTEEQLKKLETAVNAFIDGFKKIADENKEVKLDSGINEEFNEDLLAMLESYTNDLDSTDVETIERHR